MTSLRKSNVATVDINDSAGRNALKHEIELAPFFLNLKITLVNTARVIVGNVGLIARIGIVYIRIVRILIAVKLPAGGHGNGIPLAYLLGHVDIAAVVAESPISVKEHILALARRDIIASCRCTVFTCFSGIFVKSHKFLLKNCTIMSL